FLVVTFVVALVVDVFTITGFTVFTVVDGLVVAGAGLVVFVTFCDFTVEVLACAFSLTKAIVLIPIAVVTSPNTNFLLEKVRIFVFIFILFPLMISIISIIHNIFSNTIIKLMFNCYFTRKNKYLHIFHLLYYDIKWLKFRNIKYLIIYYNRTLYNKYIKILFRLNTCNNIKK